MTHHNETFECANCHHTGPLDNHGRCENCHSDAVVSSHEIERREVIRLK